MTAAAKSDLVDVTCHVHHTTERAVLVSDDGNIEKAVWLSLSLVEIEMKRPPIAEITMPEWLAKQRGLI